MFLYRCRLVPTDLKIFGCVKKSLKCVAFVAKILKILSFQEAAVAVTVYVNDYSYLPVVGLRDSKYLRSKQNLFSFKNLRE